MEIPEICEALVEFFFRALDNGVLGYAKVPENIVSECKRDPILADIALSINMYPEHESVLEELSIPELVSLAKQIPKGSEFLLMCGMLFDHANAPEKAVHIFTEAEEISKEPLVTALIKYEKGKTLYANDLLKEALKTFDEAADVASKLSDVSILVEILSRKAFTAKMLGDINGLEKSLNELERYGNYMSDFHITLFSLLKAWLERERGNIEEFKEICEAAKLEPDKVDDEISFAHAIFLAERGRLEKVLTISNDPEFISDLAYSIRGIAPAFSEELLNKAMEIDPRNPLPHLYFGILARDRGDNETALQMFKKVIELNPKDVTGYIHTASTLLTMEKIDEAKEYIERAQKVAPDNPYIPYLYGLLYIRRKDIETAKKFLQEAAEKGVMAAFVLLSMIEKKEAGAGS
ncbi:MAG: tetratricopeptide repeat protein [Candidatus Njordarchaeales archaeon]